MAQEPGCAEVEKFKYLANQMLKITWPEVTLSSSVVAAPLISAELIPVGSPTYKILQVKQLEASPGSSFAI